MRALFSTLSVFFLASLAQSKIDYLIVGGGTAGLVLANRLTEDPGVNVMVLEAGGDGLGNENISSIALVGAAWGTQIDWQFTPEPLKFANNRSVGNAPRGKVLGGSSAINGDVFDRGDAREYDLWETLGNPGWNSKSLLAAGNKAEHFFPPNASDNIEFTLSDHGLNGLLASSYSNPAPPLHDILISSVVNAGGLKTPDNAGGHVDGISHVTNSRLPSNNTRSTSATGYYFPFSFRPNLKVTLFVTVDKIVWKSVNEGNAIASGVVYVDQKGASHTINADTVILCGGTWGTPPILERSGVGNKNILSSLGIKSVIDLPGVGENLQEQTYVPIEFQLNATLSLTPVQPFLLNMESLQKTVGSSNLAAVQSLLNVQPPGLSNAMFKIQKELFQQQAPWFEGFVTLTNPPSGPSQLGFFPVNLHPHSRGNAHIVSKSPTVLPAVQYNFLQSPFDTLIMALATKRILNIVSTPPLSDWIVGPISPAPSVNSTMSQIEDYVRATIIYADHILGTAVMAPREDAGVVDANLKVYGTKNVFIVDASIIPFEPAAHLQATVYAVAERAAELFKQRQ